MPTKSETIFLKDTTILLKKDDNGVVSIKCGVYGYPAGEWSMLAENEREKIREIMEF